MADGGRKLRNIKASAAMRAFERLGYIEVRIKGSHHILTHPDKGLLVLPVHRGTIKAGIIMSALKKAGIPVEHFEAYLR